MANKNDAPTASISVQTLHNAHPQIRAKDWRSPLIARLTHGAPYSDGSQSINISFKPQVGESESAAIVLEWNSLKEDYTQCLNTYQAPVITEFAALAMACILCDQKAKLAITEVTRRGDRVDYWLGTRQLLLEVSGTESGDIDDVCSKKASQQLQQNPFSKDGYVCAARFESLEARLWFYAYPSSQTTKKKKKATS